MGCVLTAHLTASVAKARSYDRAFLLLGQRWLNAERAKRMNKVSLIGVVVVSFAMALVLGTGVESPDVWGGPKLVGFGASLRTDQAVYRSGEPIRITFEVFNHAPTPVRFDFTSSQRYDVVIEDQQGKEIWRWSSGRMFTMALGQETVGPAKPQLTYEAEYTAKLKAGRYGIKGLLTDANRQISATISVEVR